MRRLLSTVLFGFVCVLALSLALRGRAGNPSIEDLSTAAWRQEGPFELSPERGRFALVYSIAELGTVSFPVDLARFVVPDVGYQNGRYLSLFNPATSVAAVPGYLIGKKFGLAQVGSFAVVALLALFNILLVRSIAMSIGISPWAATVGALAFGFGSPAFAYATTLYQHHFSTFLLLVSIYLLTLKPKWWTYSGLAIALASAPAVDSPNIFFVLPIFIYILTARILQARIDGGIFRVIYYRIPIISLLAFSIPIIAFGGYNFFVSGNPLQLPGTIPRAEDIDESGLPTVSQDYRQSASQAGLSEEEILSRIQRQKTAINFFKTRHILNGFYTHFFSPDRGILYFSPILLIGSLGFLFLRNFNLTPVLVALTGSIVILYSMWGDPYGGWAFGSRYLIPAYAVMGIGLSALVDRWKQGAVGLVVIGILFVYSVKVNTLGALTTNLNPPRVEVLALEEITGVEQKYTYERNQDYLEQKGTKSFLYNTYLAMLLSPEEFYRYFYWVLSGLGVSLLGYGFVSSRLNRVINKESLSSLLSLRRIRFGPIVDLRKVKS